MTATLVTGSPPEPVRTGSDRDALATAGPLRTLLDRARAGRHSLAVLAALLGAIGIVQAVNSGGAPQRIDDEGTYTAQAYAVDRLGALAHYTYWYDHPPLGWMQIAAYAWVTRAFDRYDTSVLAGREAMLAATLASAALLWVLARRLGFSRTAAAAAVGLFGLSPLAVQFHRTVYLDNIAVPWVLAAMVLALSPRRRLTAFAGSGACFGIAVLSKETILLLAPVLGWMLWRAADRSTRRYGLTVAASLFVLLGTGYVLFALVKGELLAGAGHVSLVDGLRFQLAGRGGSGSVLSDGTLGRRTVDIWLQLDTAFAVAALVAAPAALLVRRLRPIAAGLVGLVLLIFRPGYLPVPYVLALLPLGALLVTGVLEEGWRLRPAGPRRGGVEGAPPVPAAGWRRRPLAVPVLVTTAVLVGVAAPGWGGQLRGLLRADLDAPGRQAQDWIVANVPKDSRLVVDDALWVDLVRAGFPRDEVVWYYKVDTDPAVEALSPNGWRDYDYVVSTASVRASPDAFPQVSAALQNSTPVAAFGAGDTLVEVRRVRPEGTAAAGAADRAELAARRLAGAQLAANPDLTLDPTVADAARTGRLDARLVGTLALLAGTYRLTVAAAPVVPGEEAGGSARRVVEISAIDGRPVTVGDPATTAVTGWLTAQPRQYRPASVESAARPGGRRLVVTEPLAVPTGLLTGP